MYELYLFFITAFVMGLARGASICVICCAPGMIPYIVAKRYNLRQSLKLGLIFSLPRIIVLTVLGIIIGLISFTIVQQNWFQSLAFKMGALGYLFVGFILFVMGVNMFTKSMDEMADKTEGRNKCNLKTSTEKHGGFLTRTINRLAAKKVSQSTRLFIIWGLAMSVACVAETTFLEGIFLGGIAGIIGTSYMNAALIGGFTLFLLAIGATIPVIIVVTIGGTLSQRIKTEERVESIKTIGSIAMVMIGLIFIFTNFVTLLNSG
jgi:type III secretory pathway component EscS